MNMVTVSGGLMDGSFAAAGEAEAAVPPIQ